MNIVKMQIKNYKSFKDSGEFQIDENIMAFIGQNNAGKSAILDAIQCVFPSVNKKISRNDFHKATEDDIEIIIWFNGLTDKYLVEKFCEKLVSEKENTEDKTKAKQISEKINEKLLALKDAYKIKNETMYLKLVAMNTEKIVKKYYLDKDSLKEIKESEIKRILPILKVVPAIRDPKNESTAGTNSYLKELIAMLDEDIITSISIPGKNVSYSELNSIIAQESAERCASISKSITEYYNDAIGVNDFEVIVSSDVNISKGTTYYTKIFDKSTCVETDILNCGTGYQSMIILSILEAYVELANKKTKYLLIIEEPEVYLHPSLQRKMIDTLIMISVNNQVIFSSHSPITVGKMNRNQIKLVRRINGEATVSNISVSDVISELGIRADDVLVNRGIIFVEGRDDKDIIEFFLNKIHKESVDEINVLISGNCDNLKFFANAEMMINNKLNIPFMIIRDSDGMDVTLRKQELIKEIKKCSNELSQEQNDVIEGSVFIVDNYSIEGYFINEFILNDIITDKNLLKSLVKCYKCQYEYYQKKSNCKADRDKIANWYQPKHLLENFEDKFKAEDYEGRNNHLRRYEENWKSFEKCKDCSDEISDFFTGRNLLNKYTHDKKVNKENYLLELVNNLDLKDLRNTDFKDLIEKLEEFCSSIYEK